MNEYNLSYTEVIADQTFPTGWREKNLNTGGTQSTLQDIKIAEKANGYCYRDSSKHSTRNRFIYWRINNDILELIEQSLDLNLTGNKIRYKFFDTPVLDGITVHETYSNVIILVPTVCSVHRLIFPHPDHLHRQDDLFDAHPDLSVPSIFTEIPSSNNGEGMFYVYNVPSTANSQLPHAAASWLTLDEEAIFLLAYPSGDLILVKQDNQGHGETTELKYESVVPKFLSGMFRGKHNDGNVTVSMILYTIRLETYAINLCRDGQLRIWSCSKGQCIAVSDILSESMNKKLLEEGAQNHVLKKVVGADESNFMFAVYLNYSIDSHFDILKPLINGSEFRILKLYSLPSPGGALIDFSLTPTRIWSVWRDKDGEWNVYNAILQTGNISWIPAILEPVPTTNELPLDESVDPKYAYLQHIFHPGRFPLQIISKALSIYKRSMVISEVNLSVMTLKQRVAMAIENEIRSELQETEVSDDDYIDTSTWCWARFYSCCVQYYVTGLRPLGIMLLPSVSGAVLLKKSAYSFLRPMDLLEHMMLCSDRLSVQTLYGHPQLGNTQEEIMDVMILMKAVSALEEECSEIFTPMFEKELAQGVYPGKIVDDLLKESEMEEEFIDSIKSQLNQCTDLATAIHKVLELLRMDQPIPENDELPKELKTSVLHLFSSYLGISLIAESFTQQVNLKYLICRNLLLLEHILLNENVTSPIFETRRSICMPEIVILLQSYYALYWLTNLTAAPMISLEAQNQRLSPLKLAPVFNLRPSAQQIYSLIELYSGSTGGSDAHKALLKYDFNEDSLAHWHTSLLPYLTQLTLIIWPMNGNALFTEWLLSSGQHCHLQQYVTLIKPWCDWNSLTRTYLLAVSFLSSGETQKAYDLFVKASSGIYLEQFIIDRVGNVDGSKGFVLYFLKVIQLFELHGAREYAIETADAALTGVVNVDEPLKMTLYSIKFKHHLALGHYRDAYEALSTNPDEERQKDNLRDLVKTLLDAKRLDVLISFNFTPMEELFISILFTRARASDSVDNMYYDFLYAYTIKKEYFRLGGSVMYEHAYRLSQFDSSEALEKQVKCLLATINCLSLVNAKFAWVLRPADGDNEFEEFFLPPEADSDDAPEIIRYKKDVEFTPLAEIKKEMVFAKARLQLARLEPKSINTHISSPKELVMFLASAGIFKTSFKVCQAFDLMYDSIFELLTYQCIVLSEEDSKEAWNWLIENDLNDLDCVGNSPSTVIWTLLQKYLEEYEVAGMTIYHRVVVEKLLTMGCYLPQWLSASYKVRNSSELLRLYLSLGCLDEAYLLAMDYLKAALGHGPGHFGLLYSLNPMSPALCLPVNTIDALIYEMGLQNEADVEKPLEKEHRLLKELFLKYLEASTRISYDSCREKLAAAASVK